MRAFALALAALLAVPAYAEDGETTVEMEIDKIDPDKPLLLDILGGTVRLAVEGRPDAFQVLEVPAGSYITPAGIVKLQNQRGEMLATLRLAVEANSELEAENAGLEASNLYLQNELERIAAEPGPGLKVAVIAAVVGALLGAGAVYLVTRK